MDYIRLAEACSGLEKVPAKLEKVDIITRLLRRCKGDELAMVTRLLQGRVFPSWSDREIGIAAQLMIKALSSSTGVPEQAIEKGFRETGDLGLVAEGVVSRKRQATLFSRSLTVAMVYGNLQRIAGVEGKGSQGRKFQLVSELLGSASPVEAKFIVRTTLGDLRIGVAQGLVRDAVAKAFFEGMGKEATEAVEWAWFLRPDYGEVACIARDKGIQGLRRVSLQVGKPYMVQLAEKSPGLEEAMKAFERPCIEYKYDGARLCIHKDRDRIWLYTRKLEDVTAQFPEVAECARKAVKAGRCILEGEMIGVGRDGRPLPFQSLSQRIKRKYEIERISEEIPVKVRLFDIVYLDGRALFGMALEERRESLAGIVKPSDRFKLAESRSGKALKGAEGFYAEALRKGHEGIIVKNMEASYHPGRRVAGGWLKVKPVMENLDLVVVGAMWGTGRRAGWLGSLILGCRDPDGGFLDCGMLGTGIKEKDEEGATFESITAMLKPLIVSESGSMVRVRPRVVIEVAYEEIQKSPTYSSGYALRFPRLIRIRDDRRPEDADDLERVEGLYRQQKKIMK